MANRSKDWFRQAEADLGHARNALADGDHEWACFVDAGAPTDYYTAPEAEAAICDADLLIDLSRDSLG